MKAVMEEMYGKDGDASEGDALSKVTSVKGSDDMEGKCYEISEQIKSLANDSGKGVSMVLAKIKEKLDAEVEEPSDDADSNIEMEAQSSADQGPKKALVIAMLKKKNASS